MNPDNSKHYGFGGRSSSLYAPFLDDDSDSDSDDDDD